MAAATVVRRVDTYTSNRRLVTGLLTLAATADTWNTGFAKVDSVQITSKTANVPGLYYTESGGTITFTYTGGGAATVDVLVLGD